MLLNVYDYVDNGEMSTLEIDKLFWDYFEVTTEGYNSSVSVTETLPRDQGAVLATYGVLLAIGGIGNLAVLVTLARTRRRKSRVDLLMTHLALADVCVTCGVIPLEIGWKYTNAWLVGNFLCKMLLVLRAFGLYLSSNVLVCISIDRFFAVIYPLRLPVARRRSKQMLYGAWVIALACSLPQSMVFRVKRHPRDAGFEQCVSFDAFSSYHQEVAYNVFCICAMYFVPLVVITVCYVCIFCEIHRSSKELDEKCIHRNGIGHVRLRRSGRRILERARRRTLRMTVTIVAVFALCWLPYATMAMWYMIDRGSAEKVSPRIQDLLFAMAVSNSCMNPLVYGSYTIDLKGALRRLLKNTCCRSTSASDTIGNSGSSSLKNRNVNLETPLVMPSKNSRVRTRLGVRFAETSLTAVPDRPEPRPRAPA
ncbi:adipokinetic hormone/corazonin-related peptide receptor variant I-like [Plodia interpunctella]|uniref:adipokinetic hormone/corazonin-related peptide receptor variant I-like n=1 Tax=Plodia interpunctella TaxID=58824 RepID=UPI0023681E01|nr:adipokinetic hormone/corazonin-related peptide receptor variant I-like [Plodia interpunctella]